MQQEAKIPKIIHYCWFGGNPLPDLALKCIESWKKFCPDYEIIEWNESNFDLELNDYAREAYQAKRWAFVSDVARLYALVNYGGIYMDTDVEVIRPLDDLLLYEAVSGFESETRIPTGLMACGKDNKMFREFLDDYIDKHFIRSDGTLDLTTNVQRITDICLKYGLKPNNTKQCVNGLTLLPRDYLCPKDYETGETQLTSNTYTIHHFDGSWFTDEDRYVMRLKRKIEWLPIGSYIAKFIGIVKYRGIKTAISETRAWRKRRQL